MHILNTQIIQKHTNEGDAYSAADIPSTFTQPWLDFLKLNIGEGKYNVYTKNQQNRDDNTYHMTLGSGSINLILFKSFYLLFN